MRTPIQRSAAPGNPSVPDEGRPAAPDIEPIRGFAEESPAGVVVLAGPAHRVLYANPAFCAAAGRPAEALQGLPAGEAFPDLDAAGHLAALERVRATGLPSVCRAQLLPLRGVGADPGSWDVETTPLRSAGSVTALLLQVRDVSAQRRAEADLQEALAAREAIVREADHRIKNSLQLVASLLRLQSTHVAEPAGRAAVDAATARVLAVAEAHRALQRSPDLRRVRLSDLLDELAAGTAVQHPGTDLRTDAAEAPTLDAERAIPLALVLAELVEAAVRRAAARSDTAGASDPMRLSARREGESVLIEVLGAGADPAESDTPGLSHKVIRALTRQIGAALATERLSNGRLRTTLMLPLDPAKPHRG